MNDLFNKEMIDDLSQVEAWFAELKQVLGLSEDANKEEVLEKVEKLNSEITAYEKERALVTAAFDKGSWDDLMQDGALIRAGVIAGFDR